MTRQDPLLSIAGTVYTRPGKTLSVFSLFFAMLVFFIFFYFIFSVKMFKEPSICDLALQSTATATTDAKKWKL